MKASIKGDLELVKYFAQDLKIDPLIQDVYNQSALTVAALFNHLEVIKYLATSTSLNTEEHQTIFIDALINSAENGYLDIVKYFIEELKVPPNV